MLRPFVLHPHVVKGVARRAWGSSSRERREPRRLHSSAITLILGRLRRVEVSGPSLVCRRSTHTVTTVLAVVVCARARGHGSDDVAASCARLTPVFALDGPSRRVFEVPPSPEQQVLQAAAACEAAWRSGVTRQRVDLLLPLIGATDLDDWPGGIRQQFKAAQPLVEGILRRLKLVDGLTGPLDASMWDDGDAGEPTTPLRHTTLGRELPGVLARVPQWRGCRNERA